MVVERRVVVGPNAVKTLFEEFLVNFFFSLGDLLKSSVELVINLEEGGGYCMFDVGAPLMELGEFTRGSLGLD